MDAKELSDFKDEYTKLLEDYKKEFSVKYLELTKPFENIQNKINESNKKIDEINSRLQHSLTQLQSTQEVRFNTFTDNIKKLTQDFDNARLQLEKNSQSYMVDIQSLYEETIQQLSNKTNELLEKLKANEEQAKKIVGIIGKTGVTGKFQNEADKHEKSAKIFRWISLGIMCFMMILLAVLLILSISLKIQLFEFIFRFAIVVTLVVPAAYAANESAKHFKLATKNRRAELELASIDPYLENLTAEEGREIKKILAMKYFGNNDEVETIDKFSMEILNTIPKLLKNVLNKNKSSP